MAVNFWAFWLGPAMRICLTTRWGNRWHEAEQKVQYQRRYATKMRAQPLFISRGVAWVMEQKWRTDAGNVGFNPFARTSKIVVFELCRWLTSWLFARWWVDAGTLLDTLIKQLDQVISLLNADDTVVHDAQPPQSVTTSTAAVLKILTHARDRWEKRVEQHVDIMCVTMTLKDIEGFISFMRMCKQYYVSTPAP